MSLDCRPEYRGEEQFFNQYSVCPMATDLLEGLFMRDVNCRGVCRDIYMAGIVRLLPKFISSGEGCLDIRYSVDIFKALIFGEVYKT